MVEQASPGSEPKPAPADGTEAVPPEDNSLGEVLPAVSLPNRPSRSIEPSVIKPIPVGPLTPVEVPENGAQVVSS